MAGAGSSSDGEGSSAKCPICLLKLKDEIGTPDGGCDHQFCLECIKEWAKNVPTCPLDREPFSNVIVKVDGREVRRERVSKKRQQADQNEEEEENLPDPVCCEACGTYVLANENLKYL